MPANTSHPSFANNQPENDNVKLWRYMDFTKFVSMLSNKSIYLSNANTFEDNFEGTIPDANKSDFINNIDNFNKLKYLFNQFKQITYINCWHMNEYESAAMWKLYSKTNESIAIETTYCKLKNVLPDDIMIGKVKYIDFEKDTIDPTNVFNSFLHKRKSFEHENEVRIINTGGQVVNGLNIEIDLNKLISKVHISPTAPSWFFELTKEISLKFNLEAEVLKSNLYTIR